MSPVNTPTAPPLVVASLLGTAQVATALPCLASLRRYAAEPVHLCLYDDGSLTPADRERLAAALGEPTIVSRPEADERVAERLAAHPACRAFRRANPLALKLFDVTLLHPGEGVAYCDTDVLFRRPFRGLFARPEGCGALFMSDLQHAYTVRSWQRLRQPWLRLAGRVNTGVLAFDRRHFDLDLLERFLSRPELLRPAAWAEQTAWALLAAPLLAPPQLTNGAGCRLIDPAQVQIPPAPDPLDTPPLDPAAVGLHFVSPVRGRLAEALAMPEAPAAETVEIRSHPAHRAGPLQLFWGEVRRRM